MSAPLPAAQVLAQIVERPLVVVDVVNLRAPTRPGVMERQDREREEERQRAILDIVSQDLAASPVG
ncbi:MAG: hypothetical protein GEV06_03545 [Luteitalea sp.]|nr:hypothetical protein [Luteitalea sp.]